MDGEMERGKNGESSFYILKNQKQHIYLPRLFSKH